MLGKFRMVGELLSFGAAAIFAAADGAGVLENPRDGDPSNSLQWEWFTLCAFVVFALLVATHIYALHQRAYSEEGKADKVIKRLRQHEVQLGAVRTDTPTVFQTVGNTLGRPKQWDLISSDLRVFFPETPVPQAHTATEQMLGQQNSKT